MVLVLVSGGAGQLGAAVRLQRELAGGWILKKGKINWAPRLPNLGFVLLLLSTLDHSATMAGFTKNSLLF